MVDLYRLIVIIKDELKQEIGNAKNDIGKVIEDLEAINAELKEENWKHNLIV